MLTVLIANPLQKGLALLAALLLFSYLYSSDSYIVSRNLTLEFQLRGLPSGLVYSGVEGDLSTVRVGVSGPLRHLRAMDAHRLVAYVDGSTVQAQGSHYLPVLLSDLGPVDVVSLNPRFVEVHVDAAARKAFSIDIVKGAVAAAGFALLTERLLPAQMEVSGPQGLIDKVAAVGIEYVASPLTASISEQVQLRLYDSEQLQISSKWLELSNGMVEYSVTVAADNEQGRVRLVPRFTGKLPTGQSVSAVRVTPEFLQLTGVRQQAAFSHLLLDPVDLSRLQPPYKNTVSIRYPDGFGQQDGALPLTAEVELELLAYSEDEALRVGIELSNLAPQYSAVANPPVLLLRSQQFGVLDNAQKSSVTATLDLADLAAGEHWLLPQLRLPPQLGQAELSPRAVLVTIIPDGSRQ